MSAKLPATPAAPTAYAFRILDSTDGSCRQTPMLLGTAAGLVEYVLCEADETAEEDSLLHQVCLAVRRELEGEFTGTEEVYVRRDSTPARVEARKGGRWRTFTMEEVALHLLANRQVPLDADIACCMVPCPVPVTVDEWAATQRPKRARYAEE